MNAELEQRVSARTAELESSTRKLIQSEERRSLALVAGNMGSWDLDLVKGDWLWDEGQYRIFGVDPNTFRPTLERVSALVDPDDLQRLEQMIADFSNDEIKSYQTEFRVIARTEMCAGALNRRAHCGRERPGRAHQRRHR